MGETKIWLRLFILILLIGFIPLSLGLGGKGCVPWEDSEKERAGIAAGSSGGGENGYQGDHWLQTTFPLGTGTFDDTQPISSDNEVVLGPGSSVIWDTPQTVDSTGIVGQYTSIALDSNKKVHISYYDVGGLNLKYATNASGAWVGTTVDSSGAVGQYTSIASDLNNKVYISYYDQANFDLKYATDASGAWVTTQIGIPGVFDGQWTSITLNANNIHISSYDATNNDVRWTTNPSVPAQAGQWNFWQMPTAQIDGEHTSIAMDSNNYVYISYRDINSNNLMCMTNAPPATPPNWVFQTVDSTGAMGQYTSIALDSNDNVHISYYDLTGNLRHATGTVGVPFTCTTVDSAGMVGQYTSIALESNNNAHISYYDVAGNLKYATDASGAWVATALDSTGTVGQYTSIAHGPYHKSRRDTTGHSFVHISYYDVGNGDLKYISQKYGYITSGNYISPVIAPPSFSNWGALTFTKSDESTGGPAGTTLTVDVLDTSDNLLAENVPSGTDLSGIPAVASETQIKLRAVMTSTNPSATPTLTGWTVYYEIETE